MTRRLALQAVALGWLAAIVAPDTAYAAIVPPFVLAGVGMGLFFAPAANVVLSAVRREEEGKASGASNAIREVGGVFGVAVLASVFSRQGGYGTAQLSPTGSSRPCGSARSRSARARSRRWASPAAPAGPRRSGAGDDPLIRATRRDRRPRAAGGSTGGAVTLTPRAVPHRHVRALLPDRAAAELVADAPCPAEWRIFILAASYIFYGWWNWHYVLPAGGLDGRQPVRGRRDPPHDRRRARKLLLCGCGRRQPGRARLLQVLRLLPQLGAERR